MLNIAAHAGLRTQTCKRCTIFDRGADLVVEHELAGGAAVLIEGTVDPTLGLLVAGKVADGADLGLDSRDGLFDLFGPVRAKQSNPGLRLLVDDERAELWSDLVGVILAFFGLGPGCSLRLNSSVWTILLGHGILLIATKRVCAT